MLFVEGNHFCMFCEKSGNCELQALAYRFGIDGAAVPATCIPQRDIDLSHPDVFLDHNRCILCGRCVRASQDLDGKNVFQFVGPRHPQEPAGQRRLPRRRPTSRSPTRRSRPARSGALMKKRVGYAVPVGQRPYDQQPIGSDIEQQKGK